jgi:hypothetical protein
MAESGSQDRETSVSDGNPARPRVRSPRVIRALVMCALAAAPAACSGGAAGGSTEPEPGHVYRGGPDADGPGDPVNTPDYAVEYEPSPSPEDATAVPAYGVYPPPPPPPPPADGPIAAPMYGVPTPEPEPRLMYGMPHR